MELDNRLAPFDYAQGEAIFFMPSPMFLTLSLSKRAG